VGGGRLPDAIGARALTATTRLRHPAIVWALSLAVGGVFLYASLDKIAHPMEFARIVYHYRLLGPSRLVGPLPANLLALTLPWIEALTGLCLVTGLWRREAALTAAGLLLLFVLAVGLALAQGIDVENCGCFTVTGAGRAAGARLIAGDLALAAAALAVAWASPGRTLTTTAART
jgi:putative oxidoreductase